MDLGDILVLIPTAGPGRAIRRELSKKGIFYARFRLRVEALFLEVFCPSQPSRPARGRCRFCSPTSIKLAIR
jgi:hypothetical protein